MNPTEPQKTPTAAPVTPAAPKPGTTFSTPAPRPARSFHGGRPSQGRDRKPGGNRRPPHQQGGDSRTLTSKMAEKQEVDIIPPLAPETIRIIPLGGVEQIGQNMTMIEYGDDIIVIDAGFQFKEEHTPGIDYILPNTKYLEERKHKVRALIVTHGHLDHIGAIPYIMDRIGNPPLYSRNLTTVMIKKRQEEFPHLAPIDYKVVEKTETLKFGSMKVRFFSVTHTIPESMGIIVDTPFGSIVHTGDLKLDHDEGIPSEKEVEEYGKFKNEKILMLMADSTNVELPGFSTPERVVHKNLEEIIKNANGRLIVATFASLFERMIKIVEIAEKYGKKVIIDGRSMKNNIEIAKQIGLLKVKKETMISIEEMDNYPPERILALVTGAQGDEFAALMRMAIREHKHFKINKRDTVVLSSSIVPGNERAVQKLKDNLSRQGAKIIHYRVTDIHASGHANKDETAWIHNQIRPRFFMPLHGYHYMLRVHGDIAHSCGLPEENIVIPDNGTIVEIQDKGEKIVRLKEKAPSGIVMVDGFSIGDIQEVVIRDRQVLAEDGMFVVVAILNLSNGKLKKSPDLISRGFVYLRESQELLREARFIIKRTIEDSVQGMNPVNFDFVKGNVTDAVSKFLFQKTAKRPIVIPVVLGV